MIYSAAALQTNTVRDYVEAFGKFFPPSVFFEPIEASESLHLSMRLDFVDIVIIHYSANFHYGYFGATRLLRRLSGFKGLKIFFTQDDYDMTNKIKDGIRVLNPDWIYTVLPKETAVEVYKEEIERGIRVENCLTGYVPDRLKNLPRRPIIERTIDTGYRGRFLNCWYGELGFEKIEIGDRFRELSRSGDLTVDIEWDTNKRIYGAAWDEFLGNCRTMLASESGCNVFDFDGSIREEVFRARRRNPAIGERELYDLYVREHEGKYFPTNQISPKMFEAVGAGTVLVMYEGTYSGIFEAGRHYIPVKKDFSNFDEVVEQIKDPDFLQAMADRAYEEILLNPDYSYKHFCESVYTRVSRSFEIQDHSPVDLTEAAGSCLRISLGMERLFEFIRRYLWGVKKSFQYLKEWGFEIWIKKVLFLVKRELRRVFS